MHTHPTSSAVDQWSVWWAVNAHPSHLGISSPCTPALPPIHDCKPLFPPRASRNPSHLLSVPRLPHHLEARTARLLAVGLRCGIACCATLNAPFTLVPPTIEAAPTPAALPASLPTAALASLLVAPLHAAVLPAHTPTDFLASSGLYLTARRQTFHQKTHPPLSTSRRERG